jgi:hypothetical protein
MRTINLRRSFAYALGGGLAALAVVAATPHVNAPAAAQSSLEARIQRLEDEKAIHDLLIEYGRDLDTLNLAAYSNLFAKEGTWTGGLGSAKGPAAILAMLQKAMSKSPAYDPNKVRSFHLMTNFHIQVDGDRATATSKWTFFVRSADNKLSPSLAGHYDDVLIREEGKWKFLSRVAPGDIP